MNRCCRRGRRYRRRRHRRRRHISKCIHSSTVKMAKTKHRNRIDPYTIDLYATGLIPYYSIIT